MERIRRFATFANVVSLCALFVALGGSSYAAVKLKKNSVGAKQIKKNAVGLSEIRKNAVRSGEVRNGSLRRVDFAAGQVPVGPAGPQGPQGPQGPGGPLTGVTVQTTVAPSDLGDGTSASYNVACPEGQVALGGGYRGDDQDSEATEIASSRPAISATNTGAPANDAAFGAWRTTVENPAGGIAAGIRPQVWVICAAP